MRKGQQKYIDKINNKNISEDVKQLFYDEKYTIEEYGLFYRNVNIDADTLKKGVDKVKNITPKWKKAVLYDTFCRYNKDFNDEQIEFIVDFSAINYYLRKNGDINTIKEMFIKYKEELSKLQKTNLHPTSDNYYIVLKKKRDIFISIISEAANNSKIRIFDYLDLLFQNDINNKTLVFFEYAILHRIPLKNIQKVWDKVSYIEDFKMVFLEELYDNWSSLLDKYFDKNSFLSSYNNLSRSLLYKNERYCSPKYEDVLKTVKNLGVDCDLKISKNSLTISRTPHTSGYIIFEYTRYNNVSVKQDSREHWNSANTLKIFLFPDGGIYYNLYKNNSRISSNKLYPLSLKKLINMQGYFGTLLSDFTHNLINFYIKKGSLIARDLEGYIDYNRFFIPGNINDIMICHNKSEMISKYKIFQNPNTSDINVLYAVSKVYPFVNEKSKGILRNLKTFDEIYTTDNIGNCSFSNNKKYIHGSTITYFLTLVLSKRVINDSDIMKSLKFMAHIGDDDKKEKRNELMTNIRDYIICCIDNKIPINLGFKSYKKVIEEHQRIIDDIALVRYKNEATEFEIPENSKFNRLREILPENFEWIQDKDRLVLESTIMHHCVYSYGNKIAADRCAIYSCYYEKENKRYTIEFCFHNGKYTINQIQSKYDRGCSPEFREYLYSLLKDS